MLVVLAPGMDGAGGTELMQAPQLPSVNHGKWSKGPLQALDVGGIIEIGHNAGDQRPTSRAI